MVNLQLNRKTYIQWTRPAGWMAECSQGSVQWGAGHKAGLGFGAQHWVFCVEVSIQGRIQTPVHPFQSSQVDLSWYEAGTCQKDELEICSPSLPILDWAQGAHCEDCTGSCS